MERLPKGLKVGLTAAHPEDDGRRQAGRGVALQAERGTFIHLDHIHLLLGPQGRLCQEKQRHHVRKAFSQISSRWTWPDFNGAASMPTSFLHLQDSLKSLLIISLLATATTPPLHLGPVAGYIPTQVADEAS